jgi:hypothetical protein
MVRGALFSRNLIAPNTKGYGASSDKGDFADSFSLKIVVVDYLKSSGTSIIRTIWSGVWRRLEQGGCSWRDDQIL